MVVYLYVVVGVCVVSLFCCMYLEVKIEVWLIGILIILIFIIRISILIGMLLNILKYFEY